MSTTIPGQSTQESNLARRVSTVRLSAQFVNRLCARIQKSAEPSQISGLLFGVRGEKVIGEKVIIVQAFKSVRAPEAPDVAAPENNGLEQTIGRALKTAQYDPEVASLELMGWYSLRPESGLKSDDITFHNAHFSRSSDLAVILKREGEDELLLELYTRANGEPISMDAHHWGAVRLRLDATLSGWTEIAMCAAGEPKTPLEDLSALDAAIERQERRGGFRSRIPLSILHSGEAREEKEKPDSGFSTPAQTDAHIVRRRQSITPQREPVSEGPQITRISAGQAPAAPAIYYAQPYGRSPSRWTAWVFSIFLCALAAGVTFAFLLMHASGNGLPELLEFLLPDTGLRLRAEGQGDRLLLSWNRRNAIVRSAESAVLHIEDGIQHRDVHLDPGQVENGLVLYRPGSNDVTFRLEVHGQQGSTLVGSVRVLDGSHVPLDLNKPVPITAPPLASSAPPPSQSTRRPSVVAIAKHPEQPNSSANYAAEEAIANSRSSPPAQTAGAQFPNSPNQVNTQQSSPPASVEESGTGQEGQGAPTGSSGIDESSTGTASPGRQPESDQASANKPGSPGVKPSTSSPKESQSTPSPAAAFTPPHPIRQVLPDVANIPVSTLQTAPRVEVEIQVSATGRVTGAHVVGRSNKVKEAVAQAALSAARQWIFEPAKLKGEPVPSTHTIIFEFQNQ